MTDNPTLLFCAREMESVDDIENIPEGAEEILNQKVDSVRIDVTVRAGH